MDLAHILNHVGEEREHYYRAVAPPIMQSSNFSFPDMATMRAGLKKEFETPFYTRGYNPTVGILRKKLAALAGSEDALVFASGSAACAAAVLSEVKQGDHVICVAKPYSWTNKLLNNMLVQYGVENTMVDGTDVANFEAAIRPNTTLIYLESPNSMTFELQDLAAVAALAKKHGITTACDNSYSTPLHQSPIALGIDISLHSASKYLNGHSDIVAGVLCTDKARADKIFASEVMTLGGIISPNDAWLMMRGLRTLEVRLERSSATGEKVTNWLADHPKIKQVIYPFHESFPQVELAKKQMKAAGGLFSIILDTTELEAIDRFCNAVNYFHLACSWGGYESLMFPTAVLYDSLNYGSSDLPFNLVRLYVGLEDPEVLIKDLSQALDQL